MLFDKLAKFVEKTDPQLAPMVDGVSLFDFPYRAHEVISEGLFNQDDLDDFILPFPSVAIEDKATCAFLFDMAEKQVGLSSPRKFIEVMSMSGGRDPEAFSSSGGDIVSQEQREEAEKQGLHQITFGTIHSMELSHASAGANSKYRTASEIDVVYIVDGRGEIVWSADEQTLRSLPEAMMFHQAVTRNMISAIEELMLLNKSHEIFIFESSPVKHRKKKYGRITRSPDRSIFIPLKPHEIRKKMGISEKFDTSTKRPHERRRHWRTLRSDRYTHKKGQRILVDACWIGQSEAVVGKRHYRVRLDV